MNPVQFGDLFQFIRNGMNVRQDKSGNGLPITRIETISAGTVDGDRVGYANLDESACRRWLLQPGDILFSHINSVEHIGKCAVYSGEPEKLVHGMNLLCLRCDTERLVPEFGKYVIGSGPFRARLSNFINKAVNQASVSVSNLKTIEVQIPPIDEQRRIAAILDRVEALRAQRRQALARLDGLTQSLFFDLFGPPASILENWPTRELGTLLDFLTSGSRGWASHYSESGDLFLRIQNVRSDELVLDDVAHVNAPDTAEARRTRVQPGDVLLSITADLGRTAVVPDGFGPAYINQHLSILRTRALHPYFLSAYLASPAGGHQVLRRNRQGVKAGLNFDDIRSLTIPVPPSRLQERFAEEICGVERLKVAQRASLAKLDELFASLQHRAFRGEL